MVSGLVVALCAACFAQQASAVITIDNFQHTTIVNPVPTAGPVTGSGVWVPFIGDYKLVDLWDNVTGVAPTTKNGPISATDSGNPDTLAPGAYPYDGVAGGVRNMTAELVEGNGEEVNLIIDHVFDAGGSTPDANQAYTINYYKRGVARFNSPSALIPQWILSYDEGGAGFNGGAGYDITEGKGKTNAVIFFDFINNATEPMDIRVDLFSPMGGDPFGAMSSLTRMLAATTPWGPGGFLAFHTDDFVGNVDLEHVTRVTFTFNVDGGAAPDFNIAELQFATPEPATFALLGFAGLAMLRRRRAA